MLRALLLLIGTTLLFSCSEDSAQTTTQPLATTENAANATANKQVAESVGEGHRKAYFGDLHVHTRHSFDAFIFGTIASPDDAYEFAKGQGLKHPVGYEMKLAEPLDFYAVTDHAAFLGILPALADPTSEISKLEVAKPFIGMETAAERRAAFLGIRPYLQGNNPEQILDMNVVKTAWADIQAAANRHNKPGEFTTFVAYEYTSGPDNQNLHRNVIFRGDTGPEVPFSRLDSSNPEDLWQWMDDLRAQGIEALAIPHNSNGSNGQMFKLGYFDDKALDASYAQTRMRNEPLVEITQVKGTSDTHPLLSKNDEWADFELMPFRIATQVISNIQGSYVREALLNGIELEENSGFNPFKFGLVGASDTHNASYAGDESEFYSKVGILDGEAFRRGSIPKKIPTGGAREMDALDIRPCAETVPTAISGESNKPAPAILCGKDKDKYEQTYYTYWGASGLTGVWAEANTREAIYDAFRRKETFATSGPRMRVRFFAGYDLDPALVADPAAIESAYDTGVPMGGELLGRESSSTPRFMVWATRDPRTAPLQRLQVVKGWVENGKAQEQVFDVACSDGMTVDSKSHRCPNNGAGVDLASCAISEGVGAAQLMTMWQDPTFNPEQRAVYYVRALENPTCRWSTWDAVKAGVPPRPDLPSTIQERAWSSPIWFAPAS